MDILIIDFLNIYILDLKKISINYWFAARPLQSLQQIFA